MTDNNTKTFENNLLIKITSPIKFIKAKTLQITSFHLSDNLQDEIPL